MWNLIADVGGTNMRLAAISAETADAGLQPELKQREFLAQRTVPSKGAVDFPKACADFVAERGSAPQNVVVAAAGVVAAGEVHLTNSQQRFSETLLAGACGTRNVAILNDFEAAAWSLATVSKADIGVLQGPEQPPEGPRLIIGPGTGLGVGALVWAHGRPHVVPGEGGHVSLSPHSADELATFAELIALWPEVQIGTGLAVEAEAILSGTGMPILYRAIAEARQVQVPEKSAADIFAAARDAGAGGTCDAAADIATEAVTLFRRFLGQLAGDLALVFGARGGVFVTGGVAQSNPWLFDQSFLDAFNAGGRHSSWRANMPLYLYQDPDFGLLGARNSLTSANLTPTSR